MSDAFTEQDVGLSVRGENLRPIAADFHDSRILTHQLQVDLPLAPLAVSPAPAARRISFRVGR
ncbi:hypothetical protein ABTZ98_02200 [Streptomyces bacillaris]